MSVSGVKFKAFPTASQKLVLSQWMGCVRVIYNAKCVEDRYFRTFARKSLSLTGEKVPIDQSYAQFKSDLTLWLKDCPSQLLRNSAVRWYQAYQRFFQGLSGRPRPKVKGGRESIWLTKELFRFEKVGDKWQLFIGTKRKNIDYLSFHAHRDFALPQSITISRERGEYFVSFSYEQVAVVDVWERINEIQVQGIGHLRAMSEGYDRGVVRKLQGSKGDSFDLTPEQKKRIEHKQKALKKHQRRLARQQKGSNRHKKVKERIAKDHAKIANIREDFVHQATHQLVESDVEVFVLEELKVKQMSKKPAPKLKEDGGYERNGARAKSGLNRSILSSCWGKLETYLGYKAERKGKLVIVVPAHYSSQECAQCHHTHPQNRVSQSEFVCQSCGHTENADKNASGVIVERGVQLLFKHPKAKWKKKSAGIWKLKKTPAGTRGSVRGGKVRHQGQKSLVQSQRSVNRVVA